MSVDRVTRTVERHLASDLARILYSLRLDHGPNVIACASDVRDTARDLVDLFGPAFGDIELDCKIERLALHRDERRALVLLTYELVANSLLHAFAGRDRGWIRVRLRGVCTGSVHLCIEDDGIGLTTETPNQNGVAYMLAHRLGGTLSYTRSISGVTCAHLLFEPARQGVN
jgi:two-component sensor histidine kinase